MKRSRFTEEQIIRILKEQVTGTRQSMFAASTASVMQPELIRWMPLRLASYDFICASVAHLKEETMSNVHIMAIELAKRSFQVCGTDRGGACVDALDFARGFFRLLLQHVASIGRVSGL